MIIALLLNSFLFFFFFYNRPNSYRGHTATVLCLTIVGKEMFTGSKDQTIMTWNLKEAKPHVIWRGKFAHNGPIRALAVHRGTLFFADGNRILAQNIAV